MLPTVLLLAAVALQEPRAETPTAGRLVSGLAAFERRPLPEGTFAEVDGAAVSETEYAALMSLVRESTVRLRRAVSCHAMNVGFNLGRDAGAGIADHLHCHIVPRWAGDTNFMPVLADVRVMPEYLDDAWRRLYASFADLPGERAPAPSTKAVSRAIPRQ